MSIPIRTLRQAAEATGRSIAWFGVPVLLPVMWTRFGWRWTLVLVASHALAGLGGLLVKDRTKEHLAEALGWVGDWAEARKGADLLDDYDHSGEIWPEPEAWAMAKSERPRFAADEELAP
jgi:hypothetical protein